MFVSIEKLPLKVVSRNVQKHCGLIVCTQEFISTCLSTNVHVRQKAEYVYVYRKSENSFVTMIFCTGRNFKMRIENSYAANFVPRRCL